MNLPKDIDALLALAERQGWKKVRTGSGHLKYTSPTGKNSVITSSSSSDVRAVFNLRAEFWRAGLRVEDVRCYVPPPEPKLVVDRNPQRGVQMKKSYGDVKKVILEALEKHDAPRFPEDILPRVEAQVPGYDLNKLKIAMNGYKASGTLIKHEDGRYSIPKEEEKPRVIKASRTAPEPVLSEEDFKVMENALDALAAMDKIIRKHMEIAKQFAGLRAIMGTVKVEEKNDEC